ncbi:hypothetical protein GA0115255_100114, partial [Streptomyces sp. Ncost-T6T-2b]
ALSARVDETGIPAGVLGLDAHRAQRLVRRELRDGAPGA